MQTTKAKQQALIQLGATCDKCLKVKVCTIVMAVGPMIAQNWEEGQEPIDVASLAVICKEYLPAQETELPL